MTRYTLLSSPISGIPCLQLFPDEAAADHPVVFVLHGLSRSKESMLSSLYAMAQHGLHAIAPDARLHGERTGAEGRDARLQADYLLTMAEIINGTVQDLSLLLDAFPQTAAALHGVSLGGYIAFSAMAEDPRWSAAAVALGSPDLTGPMRAMGLAPGHPFYDAVAAQSPLERAAETYPPRPLLMLHGDQDGTVPITGVRLLQQRLAPFYKEYPERLELVVYPGLDHVYTDDMMARSAAWIVRSLSA